MKKYLLLIVLFIFIGCASIAFEPVTHPDQRIHIGKFSFLPPKGKNWQTNAKPIEVIQTSNAWGRFVFKMKIFQKEIVGPDQKENYAEKLVASVKNYDFALFRFNHEDDFMEISQTNIKTFDQQGLKPLANTISHEKINGINCIRQKAKAEGGREITSSEAVATTIYIQKFFCIHPEHANLLVELRTEQSVVKGKSATDIQSELDRFLTSLVAN